MERYHYFASSCRQFGFSVKSLSESMQDERGIDGALATILDVLKRIHTIFFDSVGYLSTLFYHNLSSWCLFAAMYKLASNKHWGLYLINCSCTSVGCWNRSFFTGCKTGTLPDLSWEFFVLYALWALFFSLSPRLFAIAILWNVDNPIQFLLLSLLLMCMIRLWWKQLQKKYTSKFSYVNKF
jgi:hypothetical protein